MVSHQACSSVSNIVEMRIPFLNKKAKASIASHVRLLQVSYLSTGSTHCFRVIGESQLLQTEHCQITNSEAPFQPVLKQEAAWVGFEGRTFL